MKSESEGRQPRLLFGMVVTAALLAGVTAPGCLGCGGKSPTQYVPHDALVVFEVSSIKDFLIKQAAYMEKFSSDKKVSKGIKKARKKMKKNFGFDPTDPEALESAGFAPGKGVAGGLSGDGNNFCVALGVSDKEALEKTLRKMAKKDLKDKDKKVEFKKVERDGVTATRVTIEDSDNEIMAWGYHKDWLIMCPQAEDNEQVDTIIKTANLKKNIKENKAYAALAKKLSGQTVKVVVEGKSLASYMEDQGGPKAITTALEYFSGAVLGLKIDKDDLLLSMYMSVPEKEVAKMAKRFKGRGASVQLVKYIPGGALAVAKLSMNFKEYLEWQLDLLPSQMSKMYSKILKQVKKETKIDLEEDVLEILSGRVAVGYFLPSKKARKKAKESSNPADKLKGSFDGVVIAQVTKADDVEGLLKKIKKLAKREGADVKTSKKGGTKVYYLRMEDKKVLGWALAKDMVVFGTPKRLAQTIKLINDGGKSVLDDDLSDRAKKVLEADDNTAVHFRITKLKKKDLPKDMREFAKLIKKMSDITFDMRVDDGGFRYEMDGLGVLAAVAIPAFTKYTRRAKTSEAVIGLHKMKAGARQFYVTDHWDSNGNLMPKAFPKSAGWTPSKPCCKKCRTLSTTWDKDGWKQLHFAINEPHYYQYKFVSSGTGTSAKFTALARGDLDCDDEYSTFEIRGSVNSSGSVKTVGPIINDETE